LARRRTWLERKAGAAKRLAKRSRGLLRRRLSRLLRGRPEAASAPLPDLFCSRPFEWFEVHGGPRRGLVHLCCQSWLDFPVGDLRRQSVAEIWNGERAQEIRRSILDGSFRYCDRSLCPFLQTRVAPVQRRSEVTDARLREVIANRTTRVAWGPQIINCSYDRSCNLACPSCRDELIVESEASAEILAIQGKLRTEALVDARTLYITGSGDPFGSPFFRDWLRTMEVKETAQLGSIHLHTNGLLWNRRSWTGLPSHVRALIKHAEISIDAASAATYARNRGGRWETLLETLEFVAELRRTGPLEWIGLSFVVQENNFTEMPSFVGLGRRFGVDLVMFNQIVNWGTFSHAEFRSRAVHLPSHPRHHELLTLLKEPSLVDPIVHLGNLAGLRDPG
jgi:hypothetical protein